MKNRRKVKDDIINMEDPWRVFRIMSEFVDGFDVLSKVGKAITIFGSNSSCIIILLKLHLLEHQFGPT